MFGRDEVEGGERGKVERGGKRGGKEGRRVRIRARGWGGEEMTVKGELEEWAGGNGCKQARKEEAFLGLKMRKER